MRTFFQSRILPVFLAVILLACHLAPAGAVLEDSAAVTPPQNEDGSWNSGLFTMPKLSPWEMVQLLENAPVSGTPDSPEALFTIEPQVHAPYAPGIMREEWPQKAAARLSALRNLAGLPEVTADPSLNENAQYGAVILAALGELTHWPDPIADMDEKFYAKALEAVSSSNLYASLELLETPDGFMRDSDGSNVDRVGHRRWQLNPAMGKVGFGYALSDTPSPYSGYAYRRFTVEKVFDWSQTVPDYNFIAWPASGAFPGPMMDDEWGTETAWSVSLNPRNFTPPDLSTVQVTLVRESDGFTWTFSGDQSYVPSSRGPYFNVDLEGYGVSNCIIFRPYAIYAYEGRYTVTIEGLTDRNRQPVEISYQVDFFDPDTVTPPEPSAAELSLVSTGWDGPDALTVSASFGAAEPGQYALVAAAYGPEGQLLAVKNTALTEAEGQVSLTLTGCGEAASVKAFLLTDAYLPADWDEWELEQE